MRKILLAVLFMAAPLATVSAHGNHPSEKHAYTEIHADQLKSWYDQKKPMIVLDARTKPYFEGTLLPNAKWLPMDSSDAAILAAVPAKDALVVIYCANSHCPASKYLADKMASLGYTNLYKYPEGLDDWNQKGLPTMKVAKPS
jgi:rhodanese-related sulfurtransferase